MQSPMFDVTVVFIHFQLIYIVQKAWVFRKSKPSWKYCFEITKQSATLKLKKIVLGRELWMT